ncbi:phospholipid-binding protein MlaC [Pseudomonas sp.]|uniref:MlaC/ttg2D family ABC transporter substrate-binding protein n=1 Tax=Pseudomonas sp. TaxID=306 RepID=UPI00271C951A|nr:ABC transporter substrate-binding protein [Pseudomonas sp.]MDO8707067.1 ABC transporter substrate-binding protein [Pseudomonas sp.]
MKLFLKLLLVSILVASASARAADPAPDVLIKEVTQEVFTIFREEKAIRAGNRKKIFAVIEAKVLPSFDFNRLTKLAAGKYWLSASEEQKRALTKEFKDLLVRTYFNEFVSFKDKMIDVKPLRMPPSDTEATVKTQIIQPGGAPLNLEFSMWKTPQGWKIYDVSVEGIGAVATYRTIFSSEIQRVGMDGLIKSLADKNRVADQDDRQVTPKASRNK